MAEKEEQGNENDKRDRGLRLVEEDEKEAPVVFKVLLVFSSITDTVLTLHTACPLWINYTALTHT